MEKMRLGRTNLMATRTSFGALPLQRTEKAEAVRILRRAYEAGVNFFDTARGYSDSEEKLGAALGDVRGDVLLATKTPSKDGEGVRRDFKKSLEMLRTDYIDLYQFHNPSHVPVPGDDLYEAILSLKNSGGVRFIGITCHKLENAVSAVQSGLYDTVQFPFSYLSSEEELALSPLCEEHDVGLIAMKALSGGIIASAPAAFAFLRQFGNVLPIWGIQHLHEMEEFIALEANPPALDEAMWEVIAADRKELSGTYCRGCGYCLPCPAGIPINMAARVSQLLRRAPVHNFVTPQWKATMENIENCTGCGHCRAHCPYGIDAAELLKANLKDYREFCAEHGF
jgi:uncharacterized protein